MVRIISDDFTQLKTYINDYSLAGVATNSEYLDQVSRLHKRYYALLTFIAELEANNYMFVTNKFGFDEPKTNRFKLYTKEAVSDLGIALFNWINGAYKGARLLVRSSIENIIRGLSVLQDYSVSEIKNTFVFFDAASNLAIFTNEKTKTTLQALKGNYTELCKDVHTADILNMAQLSALVYFPAFDKEKANQTSKIYADVAQQCLILLSLCLRDFIFSMHHTNIDAILLNLPKELRPEIHNASR
jgi:hypothetical protein